MAHHYSLRSLSSCPQRTDETRFCSVCNQIFRTTRSKPSKWYPHHKNKASLEKAVKDDCYICNRFHTRLKHAESASRGDFDCTDGTKYTVNPFEFESLSQPRELHIVTQRSSFTEVDGSDANLPSEDLDVFFYLEEAENIRSLQTPCSLVGSTSAKSCLDQAQNWLIACTADHKACTGSVQDQKFVPTRLLDLNSPGSDLGFIKVCITTNEMPNGPYMTLSHRWPSDTNQTALKMASLVAAGPTIAVSALPQTFQDAILVTRFFSVRWLWIDCLCILQDSPEDFLAESVVMHKIYGNSYCNISATGASSNLESLFSLRNDDVSLPPEVDLRSWGVDDKKHYAVSEDMWDTCIGDAAVNRRAWVVQERLLSRRVIHFANGQLFWECRHLDACELFPSGLPQLVGRFPPKLNIMDSCNEVLTRERLQEAREEWSEMVTIYSHAQLSRPADKLVALSGLASRFYEVFQDRYIAGLWESTLVRELLWYPKSKDKSSRPAGLSIPSWSWASLDGGVWLPLPIAPYRPLYASLEAAATLKTTSLFGHVTHGELRITCRFFRFQVDAGLKKHTMFTAANVSVNGRAMYDMWYQIDEDATVSDTIVWGALLAEVDGLYEGLLVRMVDVERGIFAREGIFQFDAEDEALDMMSYRTPGAENYPCVCYDPGCGMHTIIVT